MPESTARLACQANVLASMSVNVSPFGILESLALDASSLIASCSWSVEQVIEHGRVVFDGKPLARNSPRRYSALTFASGRGSRKDSRIYRANLRPRGRK